MEHPQDKSNSLSTAKVKRAYRSPTIIVYGSVRSLTHGGGTLVFNDGSSTMDMDMTMSDRTSKSSIAAVGTHPLGIALYLFDYKPEFSRLPRGRQFGVMADEVETVMPDAVTVGPDGYKRVDYAKLGISLPTRELH